MKSEKGRIIAAVIFVFSLFSFSGCYPDRDDELSLMGAWVEEAPVEGRTEIFFRTDNRMTITREGGTTDDYEYSLVENAIILKPEGGEGAQLAELFFKQLDDYSFQIENLYVAIPEDEPTYMIFRRKTSNED